MTSDTHTHTLFRVFVRQDLCSSYDACTNSSMCSTMSPKNVVDWLSDFFLRQLVAVGATAGAASDFTFCAVFCGCSDDDEALILASNLLQTSSSQFCRGRETLLKIPPGCENPLVFFSANSLYFLALLQLSIRSNDNNSETNEMAIEHGDGDGDLKCWVGFFGHKLRRQKEPQGFLEGAFVPRGVLSLVGWEHGDLSELGIL